MDLEDSYVTECGARVKDKDEVDKARRNKGTSHTLSVSHEPGGWLS